MATPALRNRHSSVKTTTSSAFTDDNTNNNSSRKNQSASTTTSVEVLVGLLLIATLPLIYLIGIWLGMNFTFYTSTGEFALVPKQKFPDVCSTPMQMAQRKIPPISTAADRTQILQVFALIRHGNRATENPDLVCWANSTSIGSNFACISKDMHQLPSIQEKSKERRKKKKHNKRLPFAVVAPSKGKACPPGLLFDFSYDELTANGRHIRDAYITTDVERMKLFESTVYEKRPHNSTVFLLPDSPSTTDFMTISLQMFLYGLFEISRRTVVDVSVPSLGFDLTQDERKGLVKAATELKRSQSVQRLNAIREGYKKEYPSLAAVQILIPFSLGHYRSHVTQPCFLLNRLLY